MNIIKGVGIFGTFMGMLLSVFINGWFIFVSLSGTFLYLSELIYEDKTSNVQKASEMPEEAVKGLISACEDVKAGRYKVIESDSSNLNKESKE